MSSRAAPTASVRFGKWAGFFVGPVAWFGYQQIMSSLIYTACPPRAGELIVAVGVACALLTAASLLVSWRARVKSVDGATPAKVDRFIATMSIAIAGVSMLAIVFVSASGLILQCQR